MMVFNVRFLGQQLGLQDNVWYRPGCAVIPMGCASAVSIMQEIAERLTFIGRLPAANQVRRLAPLPTWLTAVLEEARGAGKPWFHVYLDNFCAMEKGAAEALPGAGATMHQALEQAWASSGVLSSAKKRVVGASSVHELGAFIQGVQGTMGPSGERVLKLVQSTLFVIGQRRLRHKWVQVLAGRWVHCMSFRRPTMVVLDQTWLYIAGKKRGELNESKVRSELLCCCCLGLLIHTNLRATLSPVTTASDASMIGGAVGQSRALTDAGAEFADADRRGMTGGTEIPVLVLSLFNGVGCAFRCYDLCGLTPAVGIAYEISSAANRVTSRRWPYVKIEGDVRTLTTEVIREWRYKYPHIEEIHVWFGFPCVGLSSVRAGRLNLDDPESGLFWEAVRIIKSIRQVFGYSFRVLFAGENVASMDASAAEEISSVLGTKPLRMDPASVVPIHRPRFCWTNAELEAMDGVRLDEKQRWIEVTMDGTGPEVGSWLQEGAVWPGFQEGAVLPTCMKCIKRSRPPPSPAGIDRVDWDGKQRWQADSFRFPPHQYHRKFVIWVGERWRLVNADERELLHGLGFQHTILCWNAGAIKADPQGFEDQRKTLVGDSFSCYSFVYIAALLCNRWFKLPPYQLLLDRMGMAPGFVCPLKVKIPLQPRLAYGSTSQNVSVETLHSALLRRVNHTGSDVRIATGTLFNPRCFPRQSASAAWWKWSEVFACRWQKTEHINSLELRAIILAIEWRIKHLKEAHVRVFHLTDSYICMSIISKGRSSSSMLKPLLARLTALLLAFDIFLVLSHVESSENPTDHASRQ